jgi:hypothetical protein
MSDCHTRVILLTLPLNEPILRGAAAVLVTRFPRPEHVSCVKSRRPTCQSSSTPIGLCTRRPGCQTFTYMIDGGVR